MIFVAPHLARSLVFGESLRTYSHQISLIQKHHTQTQYRYGNMSVAEFDLVMRNEDVVFLNNQGKTFSLYRAGVPENTTFQEECSLRSYLEIMRFNDADSSKNVDLVRSVQARSARISLLSFTFSLLSHNT